jgi:hapalindole H/12-epi-hapalindole U/12-epi-fischerindole U synthase
VLPAGRVRPSTTKGDPTMDRKMFVQIGVALSVTLLLIAGSAQAGYVAVSNPGFESATVENGGTAPIADWNWTISAYDGSGVTLNPFGYDAPDNDTTNGFKGASGNGTPLGGEGANVALMQVTGLQYAILDQVVNTTLQYGSTYTLTAAVGKVPTGGQLNSEIWISIEGDPGSTNKIQRSVQLNSSAMTAAEFVEQSVSFTPAADNPYLGQKLMIGLCAYSTDAVSGPYQGVAFDNVRLDVVVPEPSTMVLLASGLIGLLVYAWRKRK